MDGTPETARKRGFGLFVTRKASDELATPPACQPRMNATKADSEGAALKNESNDSQSADARPSTPRASEHSAVMNGSTDKTPKNRRLPRPGSAKSDESDALGHKEGGSSSPQTIRSVGHKVRQSNLNKDGLLRRSDRPEIHLRKPSWTEKSREAGRPTFWRKGSSPLGSPSAPAPAVTARRESIAGAKPVAPSFHPDAPHELKVKAPSKSVLLPFLSVGREEKTDSASADASPVSPPDFKAEDVLLSSSVKHQRPAVKMRIITWNQGSSVPKGNLEVLLGRVGEYIAPESGWDVSSDEDDGEPKSTHKHRGMGVAGQEKTPRRERIPPLPHDDAHPYHVVVIAGQECPWGDGKRLATGVGLAGELGDLGRSKSRAARVAKEKAAAREKKEGGGLTAHTEEKAEDTNLLSAAEGEFPFSETSARSVPSTPSVGIPTAITPSGAAAAGWGIGGKGWSDMCEDWLCRGPLAQATATKRLAQASKAIAPSPVILSPTDTPEEGMSPTGSRATTPLGRSHEALPALSLQTSGISESSSFGVPSPHNNVKAQDHHYNPSPKRSSLAVPRPRNLGRSISFLNRSREAVDIASTPTQEDKQPLDIDTDLARASPSDRPLSPLKQSIDTNVRIPARQQQAVPGKPHHRLGLHIPGLSAAHHVTMQSDGTPLSLGAYELVAKERCYMMYLAVYVWRGCLDRVAKTSQGHVKSGLLAGRVGNKGAVGISLKLGSSRLLFVNAHLAAHEGKVAERIANVEKIKKELKVDTFLPDDDPRNEAEDLTQAFDYAFWFGDLNFRVDITRQHADWLLMKKQYQDALAFDQLKKIMKEQPRVFDGFEEAPITFPPTFKYDVLKTIKQKREEKAKMLHQSSILSKSQSGEDRAAADASKASAQRTGMIPSSSSTMSLARGQSQSASRNDEHGYDMDGTDSIISSTLDGSAPSTSLGHHSDRDDMNVSTSFGDGETCFQSIDPIVSSNTASVEGHKLRGKAVKIKRRIFDAVNAIGNHANQKEEHIPYILKAGFRQKKEEEKEEEKRVEEEEEKGGKLIQSASHSSGVSSPLTSSPSRHMRTESYSNAKKSEPIAIALERRRRSSAGDLSVGSPSQYSSIEAVDGSGDKGAVKPSASITAMMVEYEKQPYDTSAKQRVPSWCDRVLWKSNVKVEDYQAMGKGNMHEGGGHGLHYRMSSAFSHAFHSNRRNLQSLKGGAGDGSNSPSRAVSHRRASSKKRPSTSDLPSPPLSLSGRGQIPRRRWFHRKTSGNEAIKRSTTMDPWPSTPEGGLENRTMSALDLPSMLHRRESAVVGKKNDPGIKMPFIRPRRSSLESSRRQSRGGQSPAYEARRQPIEEYNHRVSAIKEDVNDTPSTAQFATVQPSLERQRTAVKSAPAINENGGRRSTWWSELLGSHLPSFLTPHSALTALASLSGRNDAEVEQEYVGAGEELIGPRKGQIDCLLYKSLDDREMRLLEGRSDHRPVIWVGTIGV